MKCLFAFAFVLFVSISSVFSQGYYKINCDKNGKLTKYINEFDDVILTNNSDHTIKVEFELISVQTFDVIDYKVFILEAGESVNTLIKEKAGGSYIRMNPVACE